MGRGRQRGRSVRRVGLSDGALARGDSGCSPRSSSLSIIANLLKLEACRDVGGAEPPDQVWVCFEALQQLRTPSICPRRHPIQSSPSPSHPPPVGSGNANAGQRGSSKRGIPARARAKLNRRRIEDAILILRGHKVILSADLAALYGVSAKRLNEAARRNPGRFPSDFMFQLTRAEAANLKSQFATSSWGDARSEGRRRVPKGSECRARPSSRRAGGRPALGAAPGNPHPRRVTRTASSSGWRCRRRRRTR